MATPSFFQPHIWLLPLSENEGRDEACVSSLLPSRDWEYAQTISHPGRKQEYLLSHAASYQALADFFHIQPHEVPLIFNPRQRPLIQYSKLPAPYHQQPWFFSLTHTRGMAAWTLAQNPVGIDLEDDSPRLNVRDYARDYCSQPEWLKLAFIEEERDFVDLFRKIWVMKEAHFKMGVTESSDSFQKTAFTFHEDRVWCEWLGPERFGGSCYLMNPSPQYLLGLVCLTKEKLEPVMTRV